MQTQITDKFRAEPAGQVAERILRACVHCGFCLATCPTYQLLGNELDSPRGRIYLIKQLLEGSPGSERTRLHLDRCLTCRACETTCPSGVDYGNLLDVGRELIEEQAPRPLGERVLRRALRAVLPNRGAFATLASLGRLARPVLPKALRAAVPERPPEVAYPKGGNVDGQRRVLLLAGCVQPTLRPSTNAAAHAVLGRLGYVATTIAEAGCCGAIDHHLSAPQAARARMRRNIDAWWPAIEAGAEAIVVTASGCGQLVKEYGHLLRDDADYAERAARVAALARDPVELLADADIAPLGQPGRGRRIAFHPPCTLQHGQKLAGVTEKVLTRLGFELVPVANSHLCCGSAGTYAILQKELSTALRSNKLIALEAGDPELIATANIGCQHHLAEATNRPVVHWLELVAERLPESA